MPRGVLCAGIIWMVYGCVVLLFGTLFAIFALMASEFRIDHPLVPLAVVLAAIGTVFILLGYLHASGNVRDTLGGAIWSFVIGIPHLAVALLALMFGFGPAGRDHGWGDLMNGVMLGVTVIGLLGGSGLVMAGFLALSCRVTYRHWKRLKYTHLNPDSSG